MNREIVLCNKLYTYELQRKKVKNLNLHVKPDGSIYVSAPRSISIARLESFIKVNELKICEMIERLSRDYDALPLPEKFQDGEGFLYLGELKKIKILKSKKSSAELQGDILYLSLKDSENYEAKRKLFESWLKRESERILLPICKEYYPAFCPPLKEFPQIRFRKMRSRWGSCTPEKNLLCFNSCLACVPMECIEYVAAHEFTHFKHADHSANFYRELSCFMPEQRQREKRLSGYAQLPRKLCK